MGADARARPCGVVATGVDAVTKEDEDELSGRVDPEASAREAGMAEDFDAGFVAGGIFLAVSHIGLVEAQAAAAVRTFVGGEELYGAFLEDALAGIGATVE